MKTAWVAMKTVTNPFSITSMLTENLVVGGCIFDSVGLRVDKETNTGTIGCECRRSNLGGRGCRLTHVSIDLTPKQVNISHAQWKIKYSRAEP